MEEAGHQVTGENMCCDSIVPEKSRVSGKHQMRVLAVLFVGWCIFFLEMGSRYVTQARLEL
jgi:hypothetical protein